MGNENIQVRSAANLVCIQLEVHIWSGRRKMDKTDLIHADPAFARLPEKDLASLGAVKICDPGDIKAFQRVKNQAETILERAGLPILGAWGIPEDKFPEVHKELTILKNKFEDLVSKFASSFDTRLTAWRDAHLAKNPTWVQMFANLPTAAKAVAGLSFTFHPYRIAPPSETSEINAHFDAEVGGLKGQLLKSVADEADAFILSLMQKREGGATVARTYITPKTTGPLRRLTAKLGSFAFIDTSLQPVVDYLNAALDKLPEGGQQIKGSDLADLKMVANHLRGVKSLQDLVDVISIGRSEDGLVVNASDDITSGGLDVIEDIQAPAIQVAEPVMPLDSSSLADTDCSVFI